MNYKTLMEKIMNDGPELPSRALARSETPKFDEVHEAVAPHAHTDPSAMANAMRELLGGNNAERD